MRQLNDRKERVLEAVVIEYILEAEPISSDLIVSKYHLGVRSATIRNELAEMEELGYLDQPHISAGRIPSDKGYRYYVDCLMNRPRVPQSIKNKVKHLTQEGDVLMSLVQETTKLLSKMTSLMSCAIIFQHTQIRLKNFILHPLGQQNILLNLVLSNGHVENRFIEASIGLTGKDIQKINQIFSRELECKTLLDILQWSESNSHIDFIKPEISTFASGLRLILSNIAKELVKGQLMTEGEEYMLSQPEFHKNQLYWRDLLYSLTDEDALYIALSKDFGPKETITIGKENISEHLHSFSLIKRKIYTGECETGTLALMGPTRLNYEKCIPLLNFAAESISTTLTHYLSR